MGDDALDPAHAKMRSSLVLGSFLLALAFASLCILNWSIYRVAELSERVGGALIKTQFPFIGLEGVMVLAAVLASNLSTLDPAFEMAMPENQNHWPEAKGARSFREESGNQMLCRMRREAKLEMQQGAANRHHTV